MEASLVGVIVHPWGAFGGEGDPVLQMGSRVVAGADGVGQVARKGSPTVALAEAL